MDERHSLTTVLRDGFRLIARFVRARTGSFLLAVLGANLFAGAIIAAALVIGTITDELIIPVLDEGAAADGRILGAVLAVLAVATWKAAGITLRRTAAGWLQFKTQADIRRQLIDHQLRLDLAWFNRQSTGDLLAVAETDAHQGTFILAPLPFGTGAILLLIGTAGIITWIDPVLGLVAIAALVIAIVGELLGSWLTFEAFGSVQRLRGEVSAVAHESFDGALTVKALGREEHEGDRMERASERLATHLVKVGTLWGTFRASVESLSWVTIVVLLIVGAHRIRAGAITPGDLVTIAYLVSLLSLPIQLIGYVLWDLAHSLAAWRRVERVLQVDQFVAHGDLEAGDNPAGATVDGDDVTFGYDEELVLDGVELEIPAGRTIAIVGPTGSGKTTLALLMARLWDPSTGRITLDGRDLRAFARSALPGEVSLVAQESFLFDDTVRGNIRLGLAVTDDELEAAARLAAAHDFVMELPDHYDTEIGERGTTLSGGQRQRIALARALVRRPRLLILDDATSAVDPSVETDILRGLRDAELPSTVVIIAHRRSSILLADEVVFLAEGRILGHDSHEVLMSAVPGYARLLHAYQEDADLRASGRAGE